MPAQHDARPRPAISGNHARGAIARNRIPSPPCVAGASSPSASRRRPGPPRRPPCWPTTSRSLDADELPIAAVFLTGRPFPEADQRATGLGLGGDRRRRHRGRGRDRSRRSAQAYDRSSDLGPGGRGRPRRSPATRRTRAVSPTLTEVAAAFAEIEAASGPAPKTAILRDLLARSDPATAKSIVKVLAGELRIGLREGLVEAAIAKAFDRPLDAVKWAGMLTGDIGAWPRLARDDRLATAELALFHPLKFMLASPAEDADRDHPSARPRSGSRTSTTGSGPSSTSSGEDVRLYSRDLHDISGQFPEIVAMRARTIAWDGILDGEILAWRDGAVLPFIASRRGSGGSAVGSDPGRGAGHLRRLRRPGCRRRARRAGRPDRRAAPARAARGPAALASRRLGSAARRSTAAASLRPPRQRRRMADALEAAFAAARERRNEGLMVKDPGSIYSPGRRGLGWLKMKKALATIDCVVVGVEVGHGKRHGVLSRLHVRRPRRQATGQLVTIGKAYSGLTDAEIAEMTALVRGPHDRAIRALSPGRADGRRRGRVRRHRPLEPPPVGFACASRGSPPFGRTSRVDEIDTLTRSARCTRASSTGPDSW